MKGARTPRTRSRANAPLTPATPADDIPDAVDDANDAAQVAEPPTVSKRGKRAVAQPATNETAEAKVQHAETTLTAAVQKSSGKKKRFDDDDDDDLNLLEEGPYIATAAELPPSNAAKPQVSKGLWRARLLLDLPVVGCKRPGLALLVRSLACAPLGLAAAFPSVACV
jgi:hypothetical protein